MYLFLGCQIDTSKMAALVEWVFSSTVTQRTSPIMSYPSETFLTHLAILYADRGDWRNRQVCPARRLRFSPIAAIGV